MQGIYGLDFSLYEGTDMDSPPDYHFHKGGMIALTNYLASAASAYITGENILMDGGLHA
jgi:hypothetical protein